MRNNLLALVALLCAAGVYSQPTIISFIPASGPIGTVVSIKGTHFDPVSSNNIVYFGAVKALVSSATDTSLTVSVPIGATYQPISITTNNLTAYSSKPFDVTFSGAVGPFTSSLFLPKMNVASRKYPFAVANGDFDGDGKSDLIVPFGGHDSVSLYPNISTSGVISLGQPVNIITKGNDNEECNVADVDGDGKLDFIVTNGTGSVTAPTGSYSFSVFRNTSTVGSFSFSRSDHTTSTACFFAAISDLDGDGKPDVAVANEGVNTVSVFINTSSPGNISFNSKVDFVTNSHPYFITARDLDGDQRPDLVVMTLPGSGSTLSVLKNTSANGNVSFAANSNLTTLSTGYFATIGDLDGDGNPDIAATNGNAITVLRNVSSPGSIGFNPPQNFTTGNQPASLSITDLNGDGKPDLAVSNLASNTVSALRNISTQGTISLDAHVDFAVGNGPYSITCADLDGDSRPEIVSANSNDSVISVLRNVITFGNPPFISSFSPTDGVAGTQVKILGSNFTNATAVRFGLVDAASFVVDSATGITAIVANGATGNVQVTTDFGIAALGGFIYNGPVITSFNPSSGVSGTVVTIAGTNFTSTTSVKFGGAPASSFTVNSSTVITATVGAGASGNVTITSPNGTATLSGFIYNLPTIKSFSPSSGPIGTTVTISGSHFDTIPSHNIVYFGAIRTSVSAATDSTLIVIVPSGATYQPISVTTNNLTGYSNRPFVVTFNGGGLFTQNSFIPKVDFNAGNYPHSVCVADFDGDGKSDVLVARGSSNAVSVFKNTSESGTISFSTKLDFPAAGNSHEGSSVGDLDGDGRLDFVVANGTGSSTVSVFRNTSTPGNISFASNVDYPTGNAPYSVAIGDLNADGKPDVVVANNGANTISIYKNLSTPGNISFAPKIDIPTGTNPYSVAIGDLDGDGKADIALTTQGTTSSLSAMRNTSTGGEIIFDPPINYAPLFGPFVLAAGDLDGDGKLDLAAANSSSNSVVVTRNASVPGTISFTQRDYLTVGNYPVGVAINDLDGDGKPDLIACSRHSNNISVIKNQSFIGQFFFAANVDYAVGSDPFYVAAGDLDGDHKAEIIVANSAADSISILRNIVGGDVAPSITSFTPTSGINGTVVKISGTNFTGATAVSFGGAAASSFVVDSSKGITAIVGPGASGDVSVTTPNGTASLAGFTFNGPIINSFTPGNGLTGTVVVITGVNFTGATSVRFGGTPAASFTVDSSTRITATVGVGSSGSVTITTPNGTATLSGFVFGLPTISSFTPTSGFAGTIVTISGTNFDTSASKNIVFFGAVQAHVSAATSNQLVVTVPAGATYEPITVTVNNATSYSSVPFIVTFLNDSLTISKNSFSLVANVPVAPYPSAIAIADLNNDGKADLVTTTRTNNTMSILTNTSRPGSISFLPPISLNGGLDPIRISIADFDGDGKRDIAVANFNSGNPSTISVLRNTTSGNNISFDSRVDYASGNGTTGIAANDINGDGKPDIVVVSGNSATFSVFINTTFGPGPISFAPRQDYPLLGYDHPQSVSLVDLDQDGKPDVITTNFGADDIAVFKNTSTQNLLSFDNRIDYSVGRNPNWVTPGDFDGDGKLDLAVENYSSGTISIFKNNSNGGISLTAQPDYRLGDYPVNMDIADLDGDGKLDMAASRQQAGVVAAIHNLYTGTANFSFADTVNFTTGTFDTQVAIGDLDGDGKPDLAVTNDIDNNVSILRNRIGDPQITALSSMGGGDGTMINITGRNFSGATSVEFGGTAARSFTVNSPTLIIAAVGGGASGDITVTTPRGVGTFHGFIFTPAINASGPTTFCGDATTTLTSTALSNNQWYKNGISINGATAKTLVVNSSGTYSVKTTSNSVTTSSNDISVTITTVPTPVISLDVNNSLVSSASTGNQWYLDGNLIAGANGQTYHPTQSGSYTVRDTLNDCLSDFAAAYGFVVTGIINLGNRQYIRIYPNPARNILNLDWYIIGAPALNIEIMDVQGKRVLLSSLRNTSSVDLSRLSQGVYFVRISNDRLKINYTVKIIKQN
jgi:FG-GAP-like repeat/IPT/TIG domain/Secretion system C-terminal sorting domain